MKGATAATPGILLIREASAAEFHRPPPVF
jgi:hypothetical protein